MEGAGPILQGGRQQAALESMPSRRVGDQVPRALGVSGITVCTTTAPEPGCTASDKEQGKSCLAPRVSLP